MAKQTKGRQKFDMKPIADENKRHVAFSKRRMGLFNKAAEINILTGAEVAVIVFSRHGKAYSFCTPGAKSLIEPSSAPPPPPEDAGRQEVQCLMEAFRHVEEEKERREMMAMAMVDGGGHGLGFWWERPVESMENGELERFREALVELRKKVAERAEAMIRQTPPFVPPMNGGNLVEFGQDRQMTWQNTIEGTTNEIRNARQHIVEDYHVGHGGGQVVPGLKQYSPSPS